MILQLTISNKKLISRRFNGNLIISKAGFLPTFKVIGKVLTNRCKINNSCSCMLLLIKKRLIVRVYLNLQFSRHLIITPLYSQTKEIAKICSLKKWFGEKCYKESLFILDEIGKIERCIKSKKVPRSDGIQSESIKQYCQLDIENIV